MVHREVSVTEIDGKSIVRIPLREHREKSQIKYRPDIDGMRTVAVISVVLYHAEITFAGWQFLPGGYLGVDIFFVISGYLITTLLLTELDRTGQISILKFYERRARRLLPALLVSEHGRRQASPHRRRRHRHAWWCEERERRKGEPQK